MTTIDYLKIALIIASLVVGIMSYLYGPYKGQPNNPIEKVAEEIVKEETGLDIDLIPTETKPTDQDK